MTSLDHDDPQTPGQWAVRWFAVLSVALLCCSAPLVHVVWHGLLGNAEPMIRVNSQVEAPAATVENVQSGAWMIDKERELREASSIVWWLRGNYNELRYRASALQSPLLHFGKDEWLFTQVTVDPNAAGYERATPKRRRFLAEVRDLVKAAGAELFIAIVPDKASVYPDYAWPDGVMPPQKAGYYARLLAELSELDIPTVDVLTPMLAHRRNPVTAVPPGPLYFARDTHWLPAGALLCGYTVAAALEQRYGDRLSARREMTITGPTVVRAIGDLTAQLGILTAIEPDPVTGQRTVALSLLADRLAEVRDYYGVSMRTPTGEVAMFGDDPDAEVLLLGTSFAEANGLTALSLALGRPVRGIIRRGASGQQSLRDALDELRAGTKAKVVVWELVERVLFSQGWMDPEL